MLFRSRVGNNPVPESDPQRNCQINFIDKHRWAHRINCLIEGRKKFTVKPVSYEKVKEVQQGPDENPAVFKGD